MNKIILMGRLVRDPEIRYGGKDGSTEIASFSLAVDRRYKRDEADFFNCVAFGKTAEFIEKYLHQGTKILLEGEMQNDNYTDRNGVKRYGFKVNVSSVEFAESKAAAAQNEAKAQADNNKKKKDDDEWMNVPDQVDDSELPFN